MTKLTCYHQNKRVVWSRFGSHGDPNAGNVRQLRHQCLDCGRLLPSALPHSMAAPSTPDVDLGALRKWAEHDRAQWTRHGVEAAQIAQRRAMEWQEKYENYLMSDEWARRREKVFERSGGICEGCRDRRATAVHHLTYEHLGSELLWELVAVCRECHEHAHGIGNSTQARDQYQVGANRPSLRDVSAVFHKTEKAASEIQVPRGNDRRKGRDVGMQSLRLDRR